MVKKQQIILKHREGTSNRQIAIELGIDKNTVNKYVIEYENQLRELLAKDSDTDPMELPPDIIEKPKYDTKNRCVSAISQAAMPIIQECLDENSKKREDGRSKQQMRRIDIYKYLTEDIGFDISYSTVKRLVNDLENTPKEAFIKQEYIPGQQTEFDWGEVKLNIGGAGYAKYQIAVFTSAYGNLRYARLYRVQDTAAFQESHADYFSFCRGVYHTVVYDNMRVAVKTFVGPSEKEPTEALLQLSAYYGFGFRFCNVRRGNEKGHVERSVDVVRHAAFAAPGKDCFETLEEANQHLLKKCMDLNANKLSDGRIPNETFEEEKSFLMPLPQKMPCYIMRSRIKVDKYSTVAVNKVHYSVPDHLVGKRLNARIYTDRVDIYNGTEKVASHERHYNSGYIIDIFHYLRTLKRKPGALPQSKALLQADTTIKKIYEKYYTKDAKEFLLVLELMQEIGVEAVNQAIEALIRMAPSDLSASKLKLIHMNLTNGGDCSKDAPYGQDHLSQRAKQSLSQYDKLRALQGRRAG